MKKPNQTGNRFQDQNLNVKPTKNLGYLRKTLKYKM